jgi:peptide chain release factor 3
LRNLDLSKHKQFNKSLRQLESEGAVQVFYDTNALRREPILAVVGVLQFDVVQARLEMEYTVPTELKPLPYTIARWIEGSEDSIESIQTRRSVLRARDTKERQVVLFESSFYLNYYSEKFPELTFMEIDDVHSYQSVQSMQ